MEDWSLRLLRILFVKEEEEGQDGHTRKASHVSQDTEKRGKLHSEWVETPCGQRSAWEVTGLGITGQSSTGDSSPCF